MSKQSKHQNKKAPSARELIIRIVAGFLGFLMIFSVAIVAIQAYANTGIDLKSGEEIDVGIFYGSELAHSFTATSGKGFRLEIPCADGYISFDEASEIKTLTVANGENLVKSNDGYEKAPEDADVNIGGYRILISSYSTKVGDNSKKDNIVLFRPSTETTGTFNADNIKGYINRISDTVAKIGSCAFPAYVNEEYYICIGGFESQEKAENFLDAFEMSYNYEAVVIGPDKNAVSVIDVMNDTVICYFSGIKSLHVTPVANENFSSGDGKEYYGRLSFENKNGKFTVINTLYMEQYVASRLSVEVDTSWNIEALKTVATVVRTNAYSSIGSNSPHKSEGFDYCADAHCGTYHGCGNVDTNTLNAVEATKETVIKSDGRLINALYGSTYGGATVSLAEAYGATMANKGKYLVGMPAAWEDFEGRSGGRWRGEITPYDLYVLLSQRVSDCTLEGNISSVEVKKRSESGVYVTEIEFTDIFDNKMTLSGSEVIRNLLSGIVESSNFVVGAAGGETTETTLKYNADTKETTVSESKVKLEGTYGNFVFVGRGTGSGLGLSLNGVNDLVNEGYSYNNAYIDVIKMYYKQVTVEKIVTEDGAM